MPRNKSVKRTTKKHKIQKNTAKKRNTANNRTLASVQQLEKTLLKSSSQLAAQLNKEISACKKLETKLKASTNKSNTQLKSIEARIETTLKAKNSPANNKKLNKARKLLAKTTKSHTTLVKQLETATTALTGLLDQQSKLTFLGKYLRQFETEWTKLSKATSTKSQTKKSKPKSHSTPATKSSTESIETLLDDARLNEITELTS